MVKHTIDKCTILVTNNLYRLQEKAMFWSLLIFCGLPTREPPLNRLWRPAGRGCRGVWQVRIMQVAVSWQLPEEVPLQVNSRLKREKSLIILGAQQKGILIFWRSHYQTVGTDVDEWSTWRTWEHTMWGVVYSWRHQGKGVLVASAASLSKIMTLKEKMF